MYICRAGEFYRDRRNRMPGPGHRLCRTISTMTLSRAICIFLFLAVAAGCSPIYGVSYDYDRNVDFGRLLTYDWLPVPEKAEISGIDVKRIQRSVDAGLAAKGLKLSSGSPDFSIAEHLVKKDKVNVTSWGYEYGPYGRYWRPDGVSVYQYEEGTIILDFVDPRSKSLIWRGTAKSAFDDATTPEKRDRLIQEAVEKILEKFPPPSRD